MTDPALIDLIAEVICNREFGATADRWVRTLAAAEADPETYSAYTIYRLRRTAEAVIQKVLADA